MEHTTNNIPVQTAVLCAHCSGALQPDEKFCGYCGHEVSVSTDVPPHADVFEILTPTLIYYFATLLLLAVYKFTDVFPEGIKGLVIVSVIDVVIVLAFWGNFFHHLRPLFSLKQVHLKILATTIAAACVGAVVVNWLASLINVSLFDDMYYVRYLFQDTDRPVTWAIVMTCLQPAVFEEVAFRGFMFTNLQRLASAKGAVYVSAVLFGIMHLSFISLIWLVPLGIVFGMLRYRYNTLWYGIIGHFIYNFTITAIEFYS